jgi:pyridoxal phosphate enzyme (YggS family)
MDAAARRAGRDGAGVRLLAATKSVGADRIAEAVGAGVDALGENRVQEAAGKLAGFRGVKPLHMIGHLQRNKARAALEIFDIVESVDSVPLARALSRIAGERGRGLEVYIEVNTSGEPEKQGVAPEDARSLALEVAALPGLAVSGLMTVGPLTDDEGEVRRAFRRLAALREEIAGDIPGLAKGTLSMGMSGDFEVAIEEGSTLVRIGTGIFGPRGV